jgi:hypothetical protein
MFEVLERSWELAKLSFSVIKADREMLLFPLLAGLFSMLFTLAILFPSGIIAMLTGADGETGLVLGAVHYLLLFVTYLGLAFIATFFNVCVVFTTRTRFEGGDATFMDSVRFATSKAHLIFQWSMVAATVGLFLAALDRIAERIGGVGEVILDIIRGLLGMAWSIVTIFVIPAMVYDELSPMDAIRRSTDVLKHTWGESLVRHYGLGLVQFLFALLGVAFCVPLFTIVGAGGGAGMAVAVAFAVVYFLTLGLVFQVANSVFNTALYVYGARDEEPSGFNHEVLEHAFRQR